MSDVRPEGLRPDPPAGEQPLLDVHDLSVSFATAGGVVRAVDGVSFALGRGEVLAIVGESGSGKSVCAMTLMGLTRGPNTTIAGSARLEGRELIGASETELRRIRGARMAMVFQDPQSSLNPVHRVGDQIAEQIRAHEPLVSKARALERAGELMERAWIPRARERVRAYPHELSGGMRQRVMIAMALSLNPSVLLADEPTTALDVTVQAQIIEQLKELRASTNAGIVLVTHDLGVVADIADRIVVMRAGRIVEQGGAEEIFYEPKHSYTRGLLEAVTSAASVRAGGASHRQAGEPLLEVRDLEVRFPVGSGMFPGAEAGSGMSSGVQVGRARTRARIDALDGVSLTVGEGETLGVVGESGCGKTTLIRAIARLVEPAAGTIRFRGRDVTKASGRGLAPLRSELGMVFQDSQASLNPRKRVRQTLASALRARGVARKDAPAQARELLERVGLSSVHLTRFPHELSGGERQRVGIARALAGGPSLVVLDEPVSSLDASIRGQVIELLDELRGELGCGYVLVAHDLALMGRVADRIAVMYLGKVVELAGAGELYERPVHPYTQALLEAIPIPDPRASRARSRRVLGGEPPSPLAPPRGCRFHTRCPYATELCRTAQPPLVEHGQGRLAACHHPLDGEGREPSGIGVAPGERAQ